MPALVKARTSLNIVMEQLKIFLNNCKYDRPEILDQILEIEDLMFDPNAPWFDEDRYAE